MEDKIIVAVCGYPELYDTSSYFYRNRNKQDLAWRKVSKEVGQSEEVCRKKNLRDTYLKERRKETEKRSGSAAGSGKKWKYSAVLSFLDTFVSPRETSGNMERGDDENQAAGYDHTEDQGETEAAGHSETGGPRRRAQRRPRQQPSEVERELLEVLRTRPVAPAPRPRSEDELFLLSLVPSLQRLPPQTKDFVKFQIHKLIYENSTVVLNLEQLEPTQ
ncbi:hypothetical protein DPX16_0932 [Anabarilius grahami]|uniref:Transcription factor Adf-1 n=1 Tax=Anabarilius grahami TaxID=495550 RepID=A0A3N0YIZ1_ANAGA|nr:hypothetical protein DPX16_0932 [Anabarilius grahami]